TTRVGSDAPAPAHQVASAGANLHRVSKAGDLLAVGFLQHAATASGTGFAIPPDKLVIFIRAQGKEADLSLGVTQAEPPLRGEPFSAEHLWSHAAGMAARQRISISRREDDRFVRRFQSNGRFIESTYRAITAAVREGEPLAPTAEWVLDNYH